MCGGARLETDEHRSWQPNVRYADTPRVDLSEYLLVCRIIVAHELAILNRKAFAPERQVANCSFLFWACADCVSMAAPRNK